MAEREKKVERGVRVYHYAPPWFFQLKRIFSAFGGMGDSYRLRERATRWHKGRLGRASQGNQHFAVITASQSLMKSFADLGWWRRSQNEANVLNAAELTLKNGGR